MIAAWELLKHRTAGSDELVPETGQGDPPKTDRRSPWCEEVVDVEKTLSKSRNGSAYAWLPDNHLWP